MSDKSKDDAITIDRIDHLVLTVRSINRTVEFYTKVLGMSEVTFGKEEKRRTALAFGNSKLNLHESGREFLPHALTPTPGSADLCLVSRTDLHQVLHRLSELGVPVEEGPVARTGATGAIDSVYIRDPDGNLLEISNYQAKD